MISFFDVLFHKKRKIISIEERAQNKLPHHAYPPRQQQQSQPPTRLISSPTKLVTMILSMYLSLSVCYLLTVDPVHMADHRTSLSRQSQAVLAVTTTATPRTSTSRIESATSTTGATTSNEDKLPSVRPHPLIPNVLIFTHSVNLLATDHNYTSLLLSEKEQGELHVLESNVRHSLQLHPDATVRFFTDEDCEQAIVRYMHNDLDRQQRLLGYFRSEITGMYKGDLCRGVALYETGGIYLDVDLGVRMQLWPLLENTTTFATVRVHRQSRNPGAFFQAFVAVTPRHAILRRYLELFEDYYNGQLPQYTGKPLGVVLLKRAYDEVLSEKPDLEDSVEIWQETLYRFDLTNTLLKDVPPPTWGTRRACKFIVVSSTEPKLVVPLYSRIANSRMCPNNSTDTPLKRKDA